MSDVAGSNWSALPGEILGEIAHRFLIELKDFIRFQAVCKHWRRELNDDQHPKPPKFSQSVPWLMLPHRRSSNMIRDSAAMAGCKGTDNCRCFYDVTEQKFHHIEVPMPEGFIDRNNNRATWCRGSSFGWVFMLQRAPSLILFNPITGDRISLPPITAFPGVEAFRPEKVGYEYRLVSRAGEKLAQGKKFVESHYILKAALSAHPTSEECVVMVIRRTPDDITLAFCRANRGGDDYAWTVVPHHGLDQGIAFRDVAFWRGQFYAIDQDGRVYVCDISVPDRPVLCLFLDCPLPDLADHHYLLPSPDGGDLMVVVRDLIQPQGELVLRTYDPPNEAQLQDGADRYAFDSDDDDDEDTWEESIKAAAGGNRWLTGEFNVYKLNEGVMGWEEVENIDGFALFLGFNTATWVSTRDHPELGLAPNSIYYMDNMTDYHSRLSNPGSDMGIYDLATRTTRPLYCTRSIHKNPLSIFPFPVWILPSNY